MKCMSEGEMEGKSSPQSTSRIHSGSIWTPGAIRVSPLCCCPALSLLPVAMRKCILDRSCFQQNKFSPHTLPLCCLAGFPSLLFSFPPSVFLPLPSPSLFLFPTFCTCSSLSLPSSLSSSSPCLSLVSYLIPLVFLLSACPADLHACCVEVAQLDLMPPAVKRRAVSGLGTMFPSPTERRCYAQPPCFGATRGAWEGPRVRSPPPEHNLPGSKSSPHHPL